MRGSGRGGSRGSGRGGDRGGRGGSRGGDRGGRGGSRGGDRGGRGSGRGFSRGGGDSSFSRGSGGFSSRGSSGGFSRGGSRGGDRGGFSGGRGGSIGFGGVSRGGKHMMSRGRGNTRGRGGSRPEDSNAKPMARKSERTNDIDIHLASKISQEFTQDINNFKSKLQLLNFDKMDSLYKFVPPQFINQHLPTKVANYRSYMTRFNKGSPNDVVAFVKWFEWASYVSQKDKTFQKKAHKNNGESEANAEGGGAEVDSDDEDAPVENKENTRDRLRSVVQERQHMQALVQMCLRHNSSKRKEGHRALVNHFASHVDDLPKVRTIKDIKDVAHHSVSYALTRILLGMAADDISALVLNSYSMFLLLSETKLHPRVVITLVLEELNIDTRMSVMDQRLKSMNKSTGMVSLTEEEMDPSFDPDDINDPTKGERNQKISAGIFCMMAIVASGRKLAADDVTSIVQFLTFAYVEHKGNRVLTANILFNLVERVGVAACIESPSVWKWVQFAFFRFPRIEYFRPEGIQLAIMLMNHQGPETAPTQKIAAVPADSPLGQIFAEDSLEPSTIEQLANGLFRREQVTQNHPMVHPVWDNILEIVKRRCNEGESLKAHVSNIVHLYIAPYRRGNVEEPRRVLFQSLVEKIGHLALQNTDEVERMETVDIASRTVGFGKIKVAKPSDPATLRLLSEIELSEKVMSLLRQYVLITDRTPSATTLRTWALRELRSCLATPVHDGIETPYVDNATLQLLDFAFFNPIGYPSRDEINKNRAVYLFADVFSYSFPTKAGKCARPHSRVSATAVVQKYLEAEAANRSRFTTAINHAPFKEARAMIEDIILRDTDIPTADGKKRERHPASVLFYNSKDIKTLFALLFVVVSVDDPQNDQAQALVSSVIPDLVTFYNQGTIETVQLFYDAIMALIMRTHCPLHVMPIMIYVRRIAISFLYKFARYVNDRETMELVLAPLVDAYNTNDRELVRIMKEEHAAAKAAGADGTVAEEPKKKVRGEKKKPAAAEEEDGTDADEENESSDNSELATDEEGDESSGDEATDADEEDDEEADDENSNDEEAADEEEEDEEADDESSADDASSEDDSAEEGEEMDEIDSELESWADEADEVPTQAYFDTLRTMVGDVDLGFAYPKEDQSREKADIVRAITIATRVTLGMKSPAVIHSLQVLLAVLRNNVKVQDNVIFIAAKSSIELILRSQNRFFGSFVSVDELYQLLGDIQSYCRKAERALILASKGKSQDGGKMRFAGLVTKRLGQVKAAALSVLHYVAFLAQKNGASEDVREAIARFYKAIFFDKGWKEKIAMGQTRNDAFHFRHAFAWVFVPAAVDKFEELANSEGFPRAKSFTGTCKLIEAFLPRMAGLPATLKRSSGASIAKFLTILPPKALFDMKHTSMFEFAHLLKMVIEYNSKVGASEEIFKKIANAMIDDDSIEMSSATIRSLDRVEKLLGMVPRARHTKPATPVKVLYSQFLTKWRDAKSNFYRKAKAAKRKTVRNLLAYRNNELTDGERATKRRRKEDLKSKDEEARMALREERRRNMSTEEKKERRKKMLQAKQERIAKNKSRRRRVHEQREKQFQRWREAKLQEDD